MNINILGISELKWAVMVEFNLDEHYVYYCGQESLRRNEIVTHSERLLLNHAKMLWFLASGGEEFNSGPEMRLDC